MPDRAGVGVLGAPLAAGRTAELYAWGEGQVLKLFQPWVWAGDAEIERRQTAAAMALGLPVPAVGEVVRLGDRTGLVFERVEGGSMMGRIEQEPACLEEAASQLARLHLELHRRIAPGDLPAQQEVLERRIGKAPLSAAEREALLRALAQLPQGDRLCHGDFHPGNIMLADQGPVIIDWIDATRGAPAADLARSSLLFLGHLETTPLSSGLRAAIQRFHQAYLDCYLEAAPSCREEYHHWFPLMAAARLREGIAGQREWLLAQARAGLALR